MRRAGQRGLALHAPPLGPPTFVSHSCCLRQLFAAGVRQKVWRLPLARKVRQEFRTYIRDSCSLRLPSAAHAVGVCTDSWLERLP